jgi:hypothetical protein
VPLVTKLSGGFAAMTISAKHIAFLNLGFDSSPRRIKNQIRNVFGFFRSFPMVKLQNNRVGFAAFDARILRQIFKYLSSVLLTNLITARVVAVSIVSMVFIISLFPIRFVTSPTPRSASVFRRLSCRKQIQILSASAFRANLFHALYITTQRIFQPKLSP